MTAREEWLKKIRQLNKTAEKKGEETRLPRQIITSEELEWAKETVELFKCPLGFNPLHCDGKNCPTKPFPSTQDYYEDCVNFLKANMIIGKVRSGDILIQKSDYGFGVKLE